MRSIPVAMTWEILARGRWYLTLAVLGAIAFPGLLLTSLRHDGPVRSQDPAMLIMNIVMMYCNAIFFGAAMLGSLGRVSQLYAYPLRSSAIVAWRLFPAMLIVVLQMAVSIGVLNLVFDLDWPVWGPALTAAVAIAAVEAGVWLTHRSVEWLVVAVSIVGAVFGLWFKSRYGGPSSQPSHYWQQLTPTEVLTLLMLAAIAYWIALIAVSRNRRGEPPISIGLVAWLNRVFDPSQAFNGRLGTPLRAFRWFEWRRKGWVMPTGFFLTMIAGVVPWLFSSREADVLFLGFLGGGSMLGLIGFIGGVLFGNLGRNDSDFVMGHFLATRPISDADIAKAVLWAAAQSVLLMWAIWAVAFAIVCGCISAVGSTAILTSLPKEMSWWYFPATLLAPWMVAGTFTSIGLTGRSKAFIQLVCGISVAAIATSLTSKFLLQPAGRILLVQAIMALIGTTLVIVGVWVFVAAKRRGLIQVPTLWAVATAWFAGTVLVVLKWPGNNSPNLFAYPLIAGVLALIFIPLAAAPLAISANRHR